MKWTATAHVGVYWTGPDYHLGTFRFRWVAIIYGWLYLKKHPLRMVTVPPAK